MKFVKSNLLFVLGSLAWVALSASPVHAGEASGGKEGGGGFMDFNGKKILKAATAELVDFLRTIETPSFQSHPERREIVLRAIQNVQIKSRENRRRKGQMLVMDYDIRNQQIIALKPFFEGFQTSAVDAHSLLGAKQLLLHESAHLWGDDDEAADHFAGEILTARHSPKPSGQHICCGESDYAVIDATVDLNKCLELYSQKHKVVSVLEPTIAFGNKDQGRNALVSVCVSIEYVK